MTDSCRYAIESFSGSTT